MKLFNIYEGLDSYINSLKEELLDEGISDAKKYYPNIEDDKFNQLISLDPTYNREKDSASYGKWILDRYNKGDIKDSDFGHLKDVLTRFNNNKNNIKEKDINRFKTIKDLDDYLNDDNNYKDKTRSQKQREIRRNKDEVEDSELVFNNEYFNVYIPKTYEASCKLGYGATWCTRSTESDYYYNEYKDAGELYIFKDKKTGEPLYQLWVEYDGDDYEFRNKDNNFVDLFNFILKYKDDNLKDWLENEIHLSIPDIKNIYMFGRKCRIRQIDKEKNLWDFLDLPIRSTVYDDWNTAKKYNSNHDGKNNNLDKLIPQIKQELENNNLKIGKVWIPSKEEYEGKIPFYSKQKNRKKYWEGDSYWYWTSSPDPDHYVGWYGVDYGGYLDWNSVSYTIGVSFAFEILE